MAPIPDPELGPRKVDIATMYNTERYRPNYANKTGPADFPDAGLIACFLGCPDRSRSRPAASGFRDLAPFQRRGRRRGTLPFHHRSAHLSREIGPRAFRRSEPAARADVGCGKGRFARVLQEHASAGSIVALDLAEAMLRSCPSGIRACAGSMTALPFLAGSFDCAYATESLEHAVDIAAAVEEMCRIVKPGGRIVIIDKNAEQWGQLHTPHWEKWFDRKQLERMLAKYCGQVSSREISYWADVAPDGLFLAWLAEK